MKFDSEGRVALVLGRKPEAIGVRPREGGPGGGPGGGGPPGGGGGGAANRRPGEGTPGTSFSKPSDVAWDKAGNIYVADGMGTNNRVAKVDKDGRFIKQWGSTGSEPGQFQGLKAIAIDAQGDVYVADAGNKRIQVFDGEGTFKRQFGERRHAAHDVHDPRRDPVLSTCRTRATPMGWRTLRSTRYSSTAKWSANSAPPASSRRNSASPIRSTAAARTTCSSAR